MLFKKTLSEILNKELSTANISNQLFQSLLEWLETINKYTYKIYIFCYMHKLLRNLYCFLSLNNIKILRRTLS